MDYDSDSSGHAKSKDLTPHYERSRDRHARRGRLGRRLARVQPTEVPPNPEVIAREGHVLGSS